MATTTFLITLDVKDFDEAVLELDIATDRAITRGEGERYERLHRAFRAFRSAKFEVTR